MLATSITLATAVLAAGLAVDVRSTSPCPSSEDITLRLRPLLPDPTGGEPDVATVEASDADALHIRLVRANGSEVGDRRVVAQGDCAETAATVAAVIAAWKTEPRLPPPGIVPVVPNAPVPDGAKAEPAPWRLRLGAGAGAAFVGGVAAVGRLEALVGPTASRLGARVGFAAETTRTMSLYSGGVDWSHTTFEATVSVRTLAPTWSLAFDAGPALGWATLDGRDFSENRRQRSFEYGGVAGVRLTRGLGRWSLWSEVRAYGWLRTQRASVAGGESPKDLPWGDVAASVGVSAAIF